jgi:hypothetical protein
MPSAALERHPATPCSALRGIKASIAREPESVQVAYVLEGDIDRLRIPPPRPPRIAERLWQRTCCELFLAREGVPGYHEFNFSPSGEWAAYGFQRYREGALLAETSAEIVLRRAPGRLELSASVPFGGKGKLSIGLSAVVEDESGALSYWALRHAPGKPDFHHPDAFALKLEEVQR